jgi:mannonate dehydratase
MNRRHFAQTAAVAVAMLRESQASAQSAPGRMKLGTQHDSSDATLRVMAALGVSHICARLPSPRYDDNWSVEGLTRLRERIESFGLTLAAVPLPLSSSPIERSEMPDIMLGRNPARDRDIDDVRKMLQNCSRVGIPLVKYNMNILGVPRTERTPGRGGASYSTFHYSELRQDAVPTEAGPVPADLAWERITYFLDRVVPVATEYKVKLACHPHDPAMPAGKGYRGVDRVLGSVDGLKRFIDIHPSPYHGLNFCQGTVTEMLRDPNREIVNVIRYFGARKKLFNVHFRNIHGHFLDFQETFPDCGDVDMLACLRAYKEVGYDGMLMPDHVPVIPGDEAGRQAFAFAFGYIRGLMRVADA